MRQGMKYAVKQVCKHLDLLSKPVTNSDQVYQTALIASNQDKEIAQILRQIYELDPHGVQAVSIGSD